LALAISPTLFSVQGCLELTPIGPDRRELPSTMDGGGIVVGGEGGALTPCLECFLSTRDGARTCDAEQMACDGTAPCRSIVDCMVATGCYDGFGHEAANRCGLPCVLAAGVQSPSDPGLLQAVEVAGCATTSCPGLCFRDPPDGS
jgi:hypothetical protein